MKLLCSIFSLAVIMVFNVSAQVTVSVTMDQSQFLPSEAVLVKVHVTNLSGQTLHLGADPDWLTFDVESGDGLVSLKDADPPVQGKFDLESSDVATKQVNLQPYFRIAQLGHYRVIATVHIKAWGADVSSSPISFDVINGAKLWSQAFGVPLPAGVTNHPPEVRKYTLEEANYLRSQLRLYVQVSDESETRVFKVCALNNMVSFGQPEAQIDHFSNLHVLCQSGASVFTYSVINPDGDLLQRDIYDYMKTRPRLGTNKDGDIVVIGGDRRVRSEE